MGMQLTSFYQFLPFNRLPLLRSRVRARAEQLGLRGTVLLAEEGINGSLAGEPLAVAEMLSWLEAEAGCDRLIRNSQAVEAMPFRRLKVRIRPEIIRFDMPDPGLAMRVGEHIPASGWNRLLQRSGLRLLDVRNDYEVSLGSFEGAENPGTDSFGQFADWVEANLDPETDEHVAMFCTGGVRCEKASAWMRSRGFRHVYQLEGGILSYLDQVPSGDSRWRGECFVFDDRVSLDHDLKSTDRVVCHGCRKPLPAGDDNPMPPVKNSICLRCEEAFGENRQRSLGERLRQIELAESRGVAHLGPEAQD